MTIVDVEYEIYKCSHCSGFIVIREQFPGSDPGVSISLQHYDKLPGWLKKKALNSECIGSIETNRKLN